MQKKYIIYEPFSGSNAYIENMKRCWGKRYKVISLESAEDNLPILCETKAIVLNWYENALDAVRKRKLVFYKLLGVKIIWVFHNRIPHNTIGSRSEISAAKKNMKFLACLSDVIIIHSRNSERYLKEYTDKTDKVFFVPHVNYIRQYRWAEDSSSPEQDTDFRFIFQGIIAPYKNIELLIRAFKELNMPDCRLCIAGKPRSEEYADRIRGLCEGTAIQIRFEYLSDYSVGDEIRKSDVMVLPYDLRSSMNSGAMLTAFTNKRTVIVSENAMAQDYKDKGFLYVYHYADEQEHYQKLKAAMQQAYLNGKQINKEMGMKAYEYIEKYNNDDVVTQKLNEILARI